MLLPVKNWQMEVVCCSEHPTVLPFLLSLPSDSLYHTLQVSFIKWQISHLTSGNKFKMSNSFHITTSETI
jgi:hypothetical protein